jgi:predicted kinase
MTRASPEAIIFIGIPGSGKSTFFRQNFFDTHVRINLDMLKTRNREKVLVEASLKAKQSFVIDNTNVQKADRERYIPLAKEHGFAVTGYFFRSSLQECLIRNKSRPADKVVPDIGVRGRFAKLEMPSLTEGFDKLFFVRIEDNGEFIVEGWKDEV